MPLSDSISTTSIQDPKSNSFLLITFSSLVESIGSIWKSSQKIMRDNKRFKRV